MKQFKIGEKIVYPNHGVGTIEKIEERQMGATLLAVYVLRLSDKSQVFVPLQNAEAIGLRKPISSKDCDSLFSLLAEDFATFSHDWKIRSRNFTDQMRLGDVFVVADILKKLTYLNRLKPLSFREGKTLERARHLVVSELAAVCRQSQCKIEERVDTALSAACAKHSASTPEEPKVLRVATA